MSMLSLVIGSCFILIPGFRMMTVFPSFCLLVITSICFICFFVRALPSTESQFRAFRVGLSSEGYTSAISLATDDRGNTFVVGNTNGSFGRADGDHVSADSIFIAKFSRSGIMIWLKRTGSAYLDQATFIYVIGTTLYVTGWTEGNVTLSRQSEAQKFSHGIRDGFLLVYNSFTGKRLWSRQYGMRSTMTQIEQVAVSSRGGIFVTGRTNSSLFLNGNREVNDQEFFLAQLSRAEGYMKSKAQMETRSVWPFSWPQKLLIVEETSSLYVVLHTKEYGSRSMGVVISIPFHDFEAIERVLNVGRQVVDADGYYGLAHDRRSGKVVVSFTKGSVHSSASSITPTFAIRIVSNNTRPRQWTERIFSFDRGDDVVKDVIINQAGYAIVLGISKAKGGKADEENDKNSVPALWVYDVRKMKTIGSHVANNLDGLHCDKVTTFALDSEGNIVYAGVRNKKDGSGEVLLGSFGMPAEYKWRSEDGIAEPAKIYILENGSITTNEMLAVQDSKRVKGGGKEQRGASLNFGSIASICVGSALVALAFAGLYATIVKRRKRGILRGETADGRSRPANVRPLIPNASHGRSDHNERPVLGQLFNDDL